MIEDELKRIADALERITDAMTRETEPIRVRDLNTYEIDASALKNVVASYGVGIPIEPSVPAKPVDRLRSMAQRAKK